MSGGPRPSIGPHDGRHNKSEVYLEELDKTSHHARHPGGWLPGGRCVATGVLAEAIEEADTRVTKSWKEDV